MAARDSASRLPLHRALVRMALSTAVGLLTGGAALIAARSALVATLAASNAAFLSLLLLSWSGIAGVDAAETRRRAAANDPGRRLVYALVVATALASLFAVTVLSRHVHAIAPAEERLATGLCILTVALAWFLLHTTFTFRYAHLYYRDDEEGVGGIELPGSELPSYFDFAYFAFTVGMCFQVSDVTVKSPQIRRAVLLHAVFSFLFSTTVIAFVLNLVVGLAT